MTLLLTAVTPEGIVLGADTALTYREIGEQVNLMGFPKIIPVSRFMTGISIAGDARIGEPRKGSWIHTWMKTYVDEVAEASSFTKFCDGLVETVNEVVGEEDGSHTFQVAAWENIQDAEGNLTLVPRAAEIKIVEDIYVWKSVLDNDIVRDILEWRQGNRDKGYPIALKSSGIPENYSDWITEIGTPGFSKLTGFRIPDPQITAVVEYVRFLIRIVSDLHRISRQPAYVGEPIETLILFPDSKNMFSQKY